MKWLGLLVIVNLCSAADNMNIRQVMLLASLQAIVPQVEQPNQAVKPKQAVTPGVPKPIKCEPSKHKVNKMYIPNTKPKTHYGYQSRGRY